jgi:hypothetical protein
LIPIATPHEQLATNRLLACASAIVVPASYILNGFKRQFLKIRDEPEDPRLVVQPSSKRAGTLPATALALLASVP